MKKTLQKLSLLACMTAGSLLASQAVYAQATAPAYVNSPVITPATGFPYFAAGSSGTGQGVAVDPAGKVWSISNHRGLVVLNRDGSPFKFPASQTKLQYVDATSSLPEYISHVVFTSRTIDLDGTSGTNGGGRGINRAQDGNILFVTNDNTIVKLNYQTGEPMAYYVVGTSVGFPTDDVNGNIFVTSVSGNASWIVKPIAGQEQMQVVKANFALPNRPLNSENAAAIARNATITPDGRTIYVPYASVDGAINRYTSTDGLEWTFAERIDLGGHFSNTVYTPSNDLLYYVTFPSPTGANFRFGMRNQATPAQSWEMEMPAEIASAADIRGMTMTPGRDTAYFVSGTNGRIYRFIAPPGSITSVRKDAVAKLVTAFPVPSTGQVTIEMPSSLQRSAKVQVTDLSGKNVSVRQSVVSNGCSLDLTGLASGTYLVVVNTNDGKIVRRVIKQ